MSEPDVSILLVNWNTRAMTLECLRSIYSETRTISFEVIVVDNASEDGSADAIAAEFPQVLLIRESENLGFGRATNLQARQARGKKLLLLNTDTIVLDGAIEQLLLFSSTYPDARIWGGRTVFADGSLNPTSCWMKPTPWNQFTQAVGLCALFPRSRLFNPRPIPGWQRDDVRHVDIVTGCFLLIENEFWQTLNGFDPLFFMYGEEADLCLRAAQRGARPIVTPAATIVHYGGGSTTSSVDKICRMTAAHITTAQKHFPVSWRVFGRRIITAGVGIRAIGYSFAGLVWPRRFMSNGKIWREAWSRRAEWRHGFISPTN